MIGNKILKYLVVGGVVMAVFAMPMYAQHHDLKSKLQDFFFDVTLGADIEVIRTELESSPDFKPYHDPNRDTEKTIVGTIIKDENLNPVAQSNQIVVLYSTAEAKKQKKVSLKWSINYKVEDLPSALFDFEKFKSAFKPFFSDFNEREAVGQQREQISTLVLRLDAILITIRLVKYNNFNHTVSIEYRDKWKIEPIDIIKLKN